jgi:hypothetical protein
METHGDSIVASYSRIKKAVSSRVRLLSAIYIYIYSAIAYKNLTNILCCSFVVPRGLSTTSFIGFAAIYGIMKLI